MSNSYEWSQQLERKVLPKAESHKETIRSKLKPPKTTH